VAPAAALPSSRPWWPQQRSSSSPVADFPRMMEPDPSPSSEHLHLSRVLAPLLSSVGHAGCAGRSLYLGQRDNQQPQWLFMESRHANQRQPRLSLPQARALYS
jgi:hypothetical protein